MDHCFTTNAQIKSKSELLVIFIIIIINSIDIVTAGVPLFSTDIECYERIAVGRRLNGSEISSNITLPTVRLCEQECERIMCQAFSFGITNGGNGTCELALKRPSTEALSDLDYDLFYKNPRCLNKTSCFRRLAAGRSLIDRYVRKTIYCDSLRSCEEACAQEVEFNCEGFNFRYDRSGYERSKCQLTDVPSIKLSLTSDFNSDRDFDYYEKDRDAPRNCFFPFIEYRPWTGYGPPGYDNTGNYHPNYIPHREPPLQSGEESYYHNRYHPHRHRYPPNYHHGRPPGIGGGGGGSGPPALPPPSGTDIAPYPPPSSGGGPIGDGGSYNQLGPHGGRQPLHGRPTWQWDYYPYRYGDRGGYEYGIGGGQPAYGLGSGWGLPDECFVRTRTGFRLDRPIVILSLSVPSLYDCEYRCVNERKFTCKVFSFRYSASPAVPGDNCHLGERSYRSLDIYTDILPDRDYDIYERNPNRKDGCQPKRQWGSDCFERIRSGLRLKPSVIKYAMKVPRLSDCESACIHMPYFTCRAFSYRYGPPIIGDSEENCLLTDWPLPEMNIQKHFVVDPECELYHRGSYGHGCEISRYPLRGSAGFTPHRPPPDGPPDKQPPPYPPAKYPPGNEIHGSYPPPDRNPDGFISPPNQPIGDYLRPEKFPIGYIPPDKHFAGYPPHLDKPPVNLPPPKKPLPPESYIPPEKPAIGYLPPPEKPQPDFLRPDDKPHPGGYFPPPEKPYPGIYLPPPDKPHGGGYLPPPDKPHPGYLRPDKPHPGYLPPDKPHPGYLPPDKPHPGYLPPEKPLGFYKHHGEGGHHHPPDKIGDYLAGAKPLPPPIEKPLPAGGGGGGYLDKHHYYYDRYPPSKYDYHHIKRPGDGHYGSDHYFHHEGKPMGEPGYLPPPDAHHPPGKYKIEGHYGIQSNDELCYVRYSTPARLLPPAIKTSLWVPSEEHCKESCTRAREKTRFRCATISFLDGQCELSDIEQRDLRPGYDYLQDKLFWMFTWDFGTAACFQPFPPEQLPQQPPYQQHHHHHHHQPHPPPPPPWGDRGVESTWSFFTVNGQPCRIGTACNLNPEIGVWTCPVDNGDWDYCCRSGHHCGYSDGYPYPWCYVGSADKDQWRPCSDSYYPYAHSGRKLHWPVAYLHKEGPPNITVLTPLSGSGRSSFVNEHKPSIVESFLRSLVREEELPSIINNGNTSIPIFQQIDLIEPHKQIKNNNNSAMDKLWMWGQSKYNSTVEMIKNITNNVLLNSTNSTNDNDNITNKS